MELFGDLNILGDYVRRKKMTNAEKYLKDGVDIGELENVYRKYILARLPYLDVDGAVSLRQFLLEPCKPTLTEDERVILKFIENFDYIGRDEKGLYYKLQDENIKEKTAVIYNLTTNLFQFIKERRRIRR